MRAWECKGKKCVKSEAPMKKMECKKEIRECKKAKVVAETLPICPSEFVHPYGKCVHLIKVPVVLTEEKIQIDVEAEIKFEEPVMEIKRIRKNVFITQCKVMVTKYSKDRDRHGHRDDSEGKLFISGYVRKNIEYATAECKRKGVTSGEIKHLTVKVPFRCVTDISFKIANPQLPRAYEQEEFEILGESCSCKCNDLLTGKNECEDMFIIKEDFMEPIFCEFEGSKIIEMDLHEEEKLDYDYKYDEPTFKSMIEKMVVYVKVKVLQKQQVKGFWRHDHHGNHRCDDHHDHHRCDDDRELDFEDADY